MARKPADQAVNRDDIIRAAAEVLRRSGYEHTTMKDIAAEVNLTAASLYHHFRNKDALLLAVLEGGLDYVIDKLERIAGSSRPNSDKLRQMIGLHVISVADNPAVGAAFVFGIRVLVGGKEPPGNGGQADRVSADEFVRRREKHFARRDYFEKLYRDVVQAGIDEGEFRAVDAAIFTRAMLGAHNWVGVWYRESGRLGGDEIADIMADTFLRSLLP